METKLLTWHSTYGMVKKHLKALVRFGLTLQVIKIAFAAAVSWWAASLFSQNQYPYFASLAAILTLQVTVADSLQKAFYRITGIILAVAVTVLIGHWHTLTVNAGTIFILILVVMSASTAMHLHREIISQTGVNTLLVFALGNHQGYAVGRIVETAVGSAIAIVINACLFPPNTTPAAEQSIVLLSQHSSSVLKNLAALLESETDKVNIERYEVEDLVKETEQCVQTVQLAQQGLKYSPFLRRARIRLEHVRVGMKRLEYATLQIREVYNGLVDLRSSQDFLKEHAYIEGVGTAIASTAACISYFGTIVIEPSKETLDRLFIHVETARSIQLECLAGLRNVECLPMLRDSGRIITDLSAILRELEKAAFLLKEEGQ